MGTFIAMRNTLLALCLLASPAPAQSPIDSVRIVTRDIPNFWRAYDQAAGKDSAERVRIFETVYLQPGSPGLRDWMRVRNMVVHSQDNVTKAKATEIVHGVLAIGERLRGQA